MTIHYMTPKHKRVGSTARKFDPEITAFIRRFVEQLSNDSAAIFAGAGLSVAAGHVDWKGLLRKV